MSADLLKEIHNRQERKSEAFMKAFIEFSIAEIEADMERIGPRGPMGEFDFKRPEAVA